MGIRGVKRPDSRPAPIRGRYNRYDTETITAALTALAYENGRPQAASERLADQGIKIPPRTLSDWRRSKTQEYAEIQKQTLPTIRQRAAEQHQEIAELQAGVAREMTVRLMDKIEEIPARDFMGGIRNMSTASAVHTDKAAQLRGEATGAAGTDRKSVKELMRSLKGKVEVVDAEVVCEESVPEKPEGS